MLSLIASLALNVLMAAIAVLALANSHKSRQQSNRPVLVARITPSRTSGLGIDFELSNVGKGYARNISLQVDPQAEILKESGVDLRPTLFSKNIPAFAPGETLRERFGHTTRLFSEPIAPPVRLQLIYYDIDGRKYKAVFELDARDLIGAAIGQDPQYMLLMELKIISKLLGDIAGHRGIHVTQYSLQQREEDMSILESDFLRRNEETNP